MPGKSHTVHSQCHHVGDAPTALAMLQTPPPFLHVIRDLTGHLGCVLISGTQLMAPQAGSIPGEGRQLDPGLTAGQGQMQILLSFQTPGTFHRPPAPGTGFPTSPEIRAGAAFLPFAPPQDLMTLPREPCLSVNKGPLALWGLQPDCMVPSSALLLSSCET